jgi:hypothetical protein
MKDILKAGGLGAAIVFGGEKIGGMDTLRETLTFGGTDVRPILGGVLIAKFGGGVAGMKLSWTDALIMGGACMVGSRQLAALGPVAKLGAMAPYASGAGIAILIKKFALKGGGESKAAEKAA